MRGAEGGEGGDGGGVGGGEAAGAAGREVDGVVRAQGDSELGVGEGVADGAVDDEEGGPRADGVVAELTAVGGGGEVVDEFGGFVGHLENQEVGVDRG